METNNQQIISEVDKALSQDLLAPDLNKTEAGENTGSRLARLLRIIGTLVVVAASISFLVQRWGGFDHLSRYFSFLVFTASLGGLGVYLGLKIREDKSARTFLALAGGLVVVNFAQLGALVYSVFLESADFTRYPDFLLWKTPSDAALFLAVGIGLPVLTTISIASFSVLVREFRKPVIAAFLCSNLALLLPFRDPTSVGLIVLAMVLTLKFLYSGITYSALFKTFEAKIVQLHLILPLLIVVGRATYLYETTTVLIGLLSASASLLLFNIIPQLIDDKSLRLILQRSSILTTAVACLCLSIELSRFIWSGSQVIIPGFSISFICAVVYMMTRIETDGRFEKNLAVVGSLLAVIFQLMLFPGIFSYTYALLISILLSSYGFLAKNKTLFIIGLSGVGLSLINHLRFAYQIGFINPWISLAVLGTATIVVAAMAEKKAALIEQTINRFRQNYSDWK